MRIVAATILVAALAASGGAARALRVPGAAKCPVLPAANPGNQRVDRLPVAAGSGAIIASIGASTGLHADFGSGRWEGSPIGVPLEGVSRNKPRAKLACEYADETDHVRYPVPKVVHIEGGSDHHALLLDRD